MALLLMLHALGAAIWVGGMFLAYVALRPAAARLDPPVRLQLWRGTFQHFFPWVWVSVVVLLVTGYAMIVQLGGFGAVGVHVHIMHLTGLIMMALFAHLFFAPWRRLKRGVDGGDHDAAAKGLGQIRVIVLVNLTIGLATVAIGASGRWWGI